MMPLVSGHYVELVQPQALELGLHKKARGCDGLLSNVNCFWSTKSSADRDQKNCSEKIGNTPELEAIRVLNAVPWASRKYGEPRPEALGMYRQ